jgi:hypothetical protein
MIEVIKGVFTCIGVISTAFILSIAITALIERSQNNGKWYPASKPPNSRRDVTIVVDGKEVRGWHSIFGTWFMYPPDSREVFYCIECHPTKWREI